MMSDDLPAELAAVKAQVEALRSRVQKLEEEIRNLPNTWLLSRNFLVRAVAVALLASVGGLVIAGAMWIVRCCFSPA